MTRKIRLAWHLFVALQGDYGPHIQAHLIAPVPPTHTTTTEDQP